MENERAGGGVLDWSIDAMQRLIGNSPDLMVVIDLAGHLIHANPTALDQFAGEAIARGDATVFSLIHPDDVTATQEAIRLVQAGQATRFRNRCRRCDGQYRWISWEGFMSRPEGHLYGVGRDVTTKVTATRALVDSETRFRTLSDYGPGGDLPDRPRGPGPVHEPSTAGTGRVDRAGPPERLAGGRSPGRSGLGA
jgi:PAS domain S-box-containing protein